MSIPIETLTDFLVTAPIFCGLDDAELAEIASALELVELPANRRLFDEGEPGDAWYVVFSGALTVTKNMAAGPTHDIARLEAGDCFGEMAILDDAPRGAAVTTETPAVLLRFPRERFEAMLEADRLSAYKLVRAMSRVLCQRQREVTQILADIVDDPGEGPGPVRDSVVSLLWTPPVWE